MKNEKKKKKKIKRNINYFLKNNKTIDKKTEIKLSKDFSILPSNTAFFAEIQNEIPIQEDMVSLSN